MITYLLAQGLRGGNMGVSMTNDEDKFTSCSSGSQDDNDSSLSCEP